MKKLLLIALTALFMACGSSNSPDATVKSFLTDISALQEKYPMDDKANFKEQEAQILEEMKALTKYLPVAESDAELKKQQQTLGLFFVFARFESFEITDTEIDDDTAKVKVKLVFKNGNIDKDDMELVKIDGQWKLKF